MAYLLGITSIDPLAHNLLFERFLSEEKFTTPDIDIDFAADRREEVIQYVYAKYGREHTVMVCNVVTYRARSALRDMAKALDFPSPVIDRLSKSVDARDPAEAAEQLMAGLSNEGSGEDEGSSVERLHLNPSQLGEETVMGSVSLSESANNLDPVTVPPLVWGRLGGGKNTADQTTSPNTPPHPIHLLASLLQQLDKCPRHLSIHSGGMLITGSPLADVVPLEPATMPGRIVGQWDKERVEDAGLIKIDLLGLRGLSLISEALEQIQLFEGTQLDTDAIPLDDPAIYAMLQRGDTIDAFQVESRAQQQILPRLKPTCFEDIVVQVAIVRPGPIQGGAVHPYLKRRAGLEPVSYLHPSLEPVLAETLGVLLFQEQAIRVAMVAAHFTPSEADLLRRAFSRADNEFEMAQLRARFVDGAHQQGMEPATADAIFTQLSGFAGYGFCKSYAASFALIAYQTMYLKKYHPVAFTCGLLNQQPMGFYSTEVIIHDAKRHGVDLLPLDINHSHWRYLPKNYISTKKFRTTSQKAELGQNFSEKEYKRLKLRVGLRALNGLGEQAWATIEAARVEDPFTTLTDFCTRTRRPKSTVSNLIRAGAFDTFGNRRELLWQLGSLDYIENDLDMQTPTIAADLPKLDALEQTLWEHELLGYAPDTQLLSHYRDMLRKPNVLSTWQVKQAKSGQRVLVAGMIVIRQRPQTANGILFISLEDESGLLDLVVKPDVYERLRAVLRREHLIVASGVVQKEGKAVSVLVQDVRRLGENGVE